MKWHKLIVVVTTTLLVTACSHKYKTDAYDPPPAPLSQNGSAYVMLAADGAYGRKTYTGSGATLSRATNAALSKYLRKIEVAGSREAIAAAFERARASNITYVVQPIILHWEDRATEWSGRPDRITIKLVIWNPVSEKVLSTSVERASSKWATFGGDHPQDLLPRLLETATRRLFI